MESEAAGIFSVQCQTLLPFLRSLFVDFLDHPFDRLLQMHRVVDLENQFPRRYRQHGTVNRERVLAPERRREILTQVEAVIVLQLRQVLIEIRTHGTQRAQQIVNQRRGVFDHKAAYQIGIGRDVFQRTHRRRRSQPRSDAVIGLVIRNNGPRVCLAVAVFLIQNKRFQIEHAKLIQSLLMAVANRYPAQPSGMGDDLFQIGCDDQARALAIDPGDARVERRRRKAARAVRNLFQLIKLWRSNQNIAGNPNINLFIARVPRIRG